MVWELQNGIVQETVNGMLLEWAHVMLLGRACHGLEVGPGVAMIPEGLQPHGEVLHEGQQMYRETR